MQTTCLAFDSSQGNNEQERMESAQNEFRNEFRRRFHISVDDSEVSRGGENNTNIIQRVSWLNTYSFINGKILKYLTNIFYIGPFLHDFFGKITCLIELIVVVLQDV